MKLVLVNDIVYGYAANDPTAVGGAERYEWLQARALVSAGWAVTVGVHTVLPYKESLEIDGVKFVGIGNGDGLPSLLSWYRFLRTERPDWWQWQCASHWWGPAALVAKLAQVRTIFLAMHDRDIHPRQALLRRSRWWFLYAWGLAWADRIFVQHGGQLSELAPHLRSKASILPGLVGQTNSVKPHTQRKHYVVWVAVLRQVKRPDLLVEIARRMPDIAFVVCGGPSTHGTSSGYSEGIMKELRALQNVDCLGQVPPGKTLQIIADAALLLSTSDGEGFPSVFLEAWSLGTPVVSMKVDPDGVIERKGLGSVTNTVDKTVEGVRALMRAPDVRAEMAVRARQHVEETHGEAAAVRAFEDGLRGAKV